MPKPRSGSQRAFRCRDFATGADTLEDLVEKLKVAVPELLAENYISFEPDNLPFKIEAQRSEYANDGGALQAADQTQS